jgi:hypothetical protein
MLFLQYFSAVHLTTLFLQNKHAVLEAANRSLANDHQLGMTALQLSHDCVHFYMFSGCGALLRRLCEVERPSLEDLLWRFRPSVSIDRLLQELHETRNKKLKFLRSFLTKIPQISAIQQLPNIVFLLERLRQHYSYTLSREAAATMTIREMKKDLWAVGEKISSEGLIFFPNIINFLFSQY